MYLDWDLLKIIHINKILFEVFELNKGLSITLLAVHN